MEVMFLVVLGVQLLYMLLYTMVIYKYKPAGDSGSSATPVSVIVCAFNELENLKVLIPKLLAQDHDTFEVIIVNDQSIDGTYEHMMKLKEQYTHVKMVHIESTPDNFSRKKYGITLGIKAAAYDTLVFTDADCYPDSDDWLQSIALQYEHHTDIVLGVSLYERRKGFLNKFIRFETYWTAIQYLGCTLIGMPYMGVGRNLSYRKSLFLDNKGFIGHQDVMGGDDDLFVNTHANKGNTRVAISKKGLTYSYPKITWASFFRQKIRHLSVGKYYKFKHQVISGIYMISYLLFWGMGIGLIFASTALIGAGLLARIGMIYLMYYITSKKIGKIYVPLILPVLDIVYGFYYIVIAVSAVFSKRIKWR